LGFFPFLWLEIAWRMALAGAGFGLFLAPNSRLIIGSAPRLRVASAGGMVSTTRLLGQTVGATIVAALLAANFGADRTPALIAAMFALVAGLCSAARLRPARKPTVEDETW
jgi:MFS transporter, DHA2 family, multidrug resistance protein